jgi:hypothetical protein
VTHPGGGNTTTADFDALNGIKERFNDLAGAFGNAVEPLGKHYDTSLAGAGQFSSHLQGGAVKFMLAWREAFLVCEKSAGLIAGNTGKTVVDLTSVDIDQSIHLTI